jgi:hypothetical protein
MLRDFVLRPFLEAEAQEVSISGSLVRECDRLRVRWRLTGQLGGISIPERALDPERITGLWEGTCFELFVAPVHSGGYWEVNVSPAGHWNVFGFASYRLGMSEEAAFGSLPVEVWRSDSELSLAFDLDLVPIVSSKTALHAGVAAVIRHAQGGLSFWALRHRGPRPDFHLRESFALSL